MDTLKYKVGYYIHRKYPGRITCTPSFFHEENDEILRDLNGYSYESVKEFVTGLKNVLNGVKIWNGDDYDYQWSGGEIIGLVSNEQRTIIEDMFSNEVLEVRTIDIYNLLLERMKLMVDYPINLIKRMILDSIEHKDSRQFSNIHIEFAMKPEFIDIIRNDIDIVVFEEKYFKNNL